MNTDSRVSIVIATHNRRERLGATLERLTAQRAPIVVVDNASNDGTPAMIGVRFPNVQLVRLSRNAGAFARTIGVERTSTPYIAFADDDTWWLPGSLERGAAIFDQHPRIGLLNARVTVNGDKRRDPACERMEQVPCEDEIPGVPIAFFMAGACMVRRCAFLESGGYEPRFVIGAEETLLAIDLRKKGWLLRYVPSLRVRHDPCPIGRNATLRRRRVIRNRLWTAWMRLTPTDALHITANATVRAVRDSEFRSALIDAVGGLPWALGRRECVDAALSAQVRGLWSSDA